MVAPTAASYIAASTGHSVVLALLPALPLAGTWVGAGRVAPPQPVCHRRHGTNRTEGRYVPAIAVRPGALPPGERKPRVRAPAGERTGAGLPGPVAPRGTPG